MKNESKSVCLGVAAIVASTFACSPPIEERAALAIIKSCPVANADDENARDRCANNLANLLELKEASSDPIAWGVQAPSTTISNALDASEVADLHPLVFRKLYLSTFMFEDQSIVVEDAGDRRVVRLHVQFRHAMSAGAYPYPFWHSEKKWNSYQQTHELLFYFQDGVFIGALRSNEKDEDRATTTRLFDGNWTWDEGREPHVALPAYLLSADNPYVLAVENTYRTLERALRSENCLSCHNPTNPSNMQHLELLDYPNQALEGRHDIVKMMLQNRMPPLVGIPDLHRREAMIDLANEFAAAGDAAFAFESGR